MVRASQAAGVRMDKTPTLKDIFLDIGGIAWTYAGLGNLEVEDGTHAQVLLCNFMHDVGCECCAIAYD